eukprot:2505562-Pyramimonas_sp.AAC.1
MGAQGGRRQGHQYRACRLHQHFQDGQRGGPAAAQSDPQNMQCAKSHGLAERAHASRVSYEIDCVWS